MVDEELNVGEGQFVRSVLFLANGNIEILEQILNELTAPRDVIIESEKEAGSLNHWFAISFEEIEQLKGKQYSGDIFKKTQRSKSDDLPF